MKGDKPKTYIKWLIKSNPVTLSLYDQLRDQGLTDSQAAKRIIQNKETSKHERP